MRLRPTRRSLWIVVALTISMLAAGVIQAQDQDIPLPDKGQLLPADVLGATAPTRAATSTVIPVSGPETWAADGQWNLVDGTWIHAGSDNSDNMLASSAFVLPTTTSVSERILVGIEENFEFESGYDHGQVLVSTDGANWYLVGQRTGDSGDRTSYADLTSWAGQTVQVAFRYESDVSDSFAGWNITGMSATLWRDVTDPLECTINDLQFNTFPFIYMDVKVFTYGEPLPDLVQDDFVAYENGVVQTDYFQVIPPAGGSGTRTADIIFVLDVTGSMGGEIGAVRTNMANFVDALVAEGIDYRIGFVRFWDYVEVLNGGNLYSDYDEIQAVINGFWVSGGGDYPEDSVDAMAAATDMNFRPGAQRIEIMLTDATSHVSDYVGSMSVNQLINNHLLPANVSVYPVFYTDRADQLAQYQPIAVATNPTGAIYNLYDNFNAIIDDIIADFGSTYRVRYRSSDPTFNCVLRDVVIEVVNGGDMSTCADSYTPCEIPSIERTAETAALSDVQQPEFMPLTFAADVTDEFEPYINDVRLYYRTTGTAIYSYLAMTDMGGGTWTVDLPGGSVVGPGVDYYLWGGEGFMSVTDPASDPGLLPYQIAVYPNFPPQIEHNPITVLTPGVAVEINAAVTDSTDYVMSVELWYREYGNLIWLTAPMPPIVDDWFTGMVPAATVVSGGFEYMIRATDNFGVTAVHGVHLVGGPDDDPELGCLWIDGTTGPLADEHDGLGVAWGDYDDDGDDDLFLANAGWNVLLRNDRDGIFTKMDVNLGAGTSRAGTWVDYDNDGDLDLFVVNFGQANQLFRNDGGVFVDVTTPALANDGNGTACAWGDVDGDYDLDLFLANEGDENVLYLNNDGVLEPMLGSALAFTDLCRGCAFGDYDGDGDPDLYITVKDGPNYLFRNDRAAFVDVSDAPVNDMGDGKGCAWADYDNDGKLDLYVVNKDGSNRLFHNDGDGWFHDMTDAVVGDEGDGRTAVWGDYDNDGWLDLFVTNYSDANKLFHNLRNGSFADSTCGALASQAMTAWGAAFNDDDMDGDLDLYVANHTWTGEPNRMFRNTRNSASWLRIALEGVDSNSHGVGAVIEIITDEGTQTRHVTNGANYLAQSSVVQHVGVGNATSAVIRVYWPAGRVQDIMVTGLEHTIIINEASVTGVDSPVLPTAFSLACYPNPFNPTTKVTFGLPRDADVSLNIYDVTGRLVRTLIAGDSMNSGTHFAEWNGRDNQGRGTSSGVYFARIVAGEYRDSIRMVLFK